MAAGDQVVDKLVEGLVSFTKMQRQYTETMQEIFSDRRSIPFAGTEEKILVRRQKLRKEELEKAKEGTKAAAKLNGALESLAESVRNNNRATRMQLSVTEESIKDVLSHVKAMSTADAEYLASVNQMIQSHQDITNELPQLQTVIERVGKQQSELYNKQAVVVKHSDQVANSLLDLRESIEKSIKSFFTMTTAFTLAASGVKKGFEQIETSLKHQVPIMDLLSGGISNAAAAYGVTTDMLMRVQNEYTQSLLAANRAVGGLRGSAKNTLEEFGTLRKSLYDVTGSYDEALKVFGATREMMSFAGVHLSSKEFVKMMKSKGGMIDSMKTLAAITNKSFEEIAQMNIQLLKDRDMRFTMLALDERQRQNRIKEITQYQTLLVAKGMEAEQALQAAANLEKLNKMISPKERLKQAARIRGLSGALGIGGGDRAMALAMKPPSKWNEQDKIFMQQFATDLESKMGKLYGGSVPEQLVGGAFMEKMGGELYDNIIATQSTAGYEGRVLPAAAVEQISIQRNQLSQGQQTLANVKGIFESLTAWGGDSGIFLAGAAAAGIGSIVVQLGMANRFLGIIAASSPGGAAAVAKKGLGGMAARGLGAVAAATGAYAVGHTIGTFANEQLGISDKINDAAWKVQDKKIDNAYKTAMEINKQVQTEWLKQQRANPPQDPAILALVEAVEKNISNNEYLTKEQMKLYREQVKELKSINKESMKQNDVLSSMDSTGFNSSRWPNNNL